MNEQDLDLDNLDNLLDDFDGVTVEGGVDSENDDGCEAERAKSNSGRLKTGKQTT